MAFLFISPPFSGKFLTLNPEKVNSVPNKRKCENIKTIIAGCSLQFVGSSGGVQKSGSSINGPSNNN